MLTAAPKYNVARNIVNKCLSLTAHIFENVLLEMCVCVCVDITVNKEFIRAITRLEVSESKAQVDDRPFNGAVAGILHTAIRCLWI